MYNRMSSSRSSASLRTLISFALSRKYATRLHDIAPVLTNFQVDFYRQNGYCIVPKFKSLLETKSLRQRISEIVNMEVSKDLTSPRTIFLTINHSHRNSSYFLESGDKIRVFFEEDAFEADGKTLISSEPLHCVNKVGHNLHELDTVFSKFSYDPRIHKLFSQLGMKQPLLTQSMYIFKQPKMGGKVCAHQDSTFLWTDPPTTIGLWFALEDASVENGCLYGIPGSHRFNVAQRNILTSDKKSTEFRPQTPPNWDLSKMIPLEMNEGSVVVFDGAFVHMSYDNKSSKSRHALTLHAMDAETSTWSSENWLQRSTPFRPY